MSLPGEKSYVYELSGSCGRTSIDVSIRSDETCTVRLCFDWMGFKKDNCTLVGRVADRTGARLTLNLKDTDEHEAYVELYQLDQPYQFGPYTEEVACMVMAQNGSANKGRCYDTLFVLRAPTCSRWHDKMFYLSSDAVAAGPNCRDPAED